MKEFKYYLFLWDVCKQPVSYPADTPWQEIKADSYLWCPSKDTRVKKITKEEYDKLVKERYGL